MVKSLGRFVSIILITYSLTSCSDTPSSHTSAKAKRIETSDTLSKMDEKPKSTFEWHIQYVECKFINRGPPLHSLTIIKTILIFLGVSPWRDRVNKPISVSWSKWSRGSWLHWTWHWSILWREIVDQTIHSGTYTVSRGRRGRWPCYSFKDDSQIEKYTSNEIEKLRQTKEKRLCNLRYSRLT